MGERLHARERVAHARLAARYAPSTASIVSPEMRDSPVYTSTPRASQLVTTFGEHRQIARRRRRSVEGEQQRAAVRGGVVILESAGDAELLDLRGAAQLGERCAVERLAGERRERAGERDAGRG